MGSAGGGEHWNASPCRTNVVVNLFFGAWGEACSLAWPDDWSDTSGPDMCQLGYLPRRQIHQGQTRRPVRLLLCSLQGLRVKGVKEICGLFSATARPRGPSCRAPGPGEQSLAWPRTCQTRSCQSGFYQLTPGSLSFQRTAASRRMRQSRPPAHSPREPGTLTTTMQPRSVGVA